MKSKDMLYTTNKSIQTDNPIYARQLDPTGASPGLVSEPAIINTEDPQTVNQSAGGVLVAGIVLILGLSFIAPRLEQYGFNNVKPSAVNLLIITIMAVVGLGVVKQIAARIPSDVLGVKTLILSV